MSKEEKAKEYKPCPFCGIHPIIDKYYAPSIVECRCVNPDCHVQPVLIVQVECEMYPDGQSYYPLFEKAYPVLLEKWNTRSESAQLAAYKEALRELVDECEFMVIPDIRSMNHLYKEEIDIDKLQDLLTKAKTLIE